MLVTSEKQRRARIRMHLSLLNVPTWRVSKRSLYVHSCERDLRFVQHKAQRGDQICDCDLRMMGRYKEAPNESKDVRIETNEGTMIEMRHIVAQD